MWGGGDIPSQGAEIRGLSHGPTFQRCGDAAHLIEACVPLTADHLEREQEEAQLGLKIPLLAGRAASGGPACGKHGTLIPSAQRLVRAAKQALGKAALGALFA